MYEMDKIYKDFLAYFDHYRLNIVSHPKDVGS